MRARRRSAAFTLVELMTVVAIVGVVAALAARLYSRGVSGESAPKFARTMMATLLDARHQAMALGRPTEVKLVSSSAGGSIATYAYDPTAGSWPSSAQQTIYLPSTVWLCTSVQGVSNLGSAVTPACPLSGTHNVCFWPNGRASINTDGSTCSSTSPSSGTGGTLYLSSRTGDKNYRIWIWGLTGMIKMIDRW